MADQRRRRGRSGRGGRIPRKGEAAQVATAPGEAFVSFPLEAAGPISVPSPLREDAISGGLRETLALERQYRASLRAMAASGGDPVITGLSADADRHLSRLEELAQQIQAAGSNGGTAGAMDLAQLSAHLELLQIAWLRLQRLAYATGTPQLEELTHPIIQEKARHAVILRELAVQAGCRSAFREVEY